MSPDYTERDDQGFGRRFLAAALLGSIPVWLGLLVAFWLRAPWPVLLAVVGITLPIPLTLLVLRHRWTRCPACGASVRVLWSDGAFRRGDELSYTCARCRIRWNTHLRPGSDV